jgi:hypothetical protein
LFGAVEDRHADLFGRGARRRLTRDDGDLVVLDLRLTLEKRMRATLLSSSQPSGSASATRRLRHCPNARRTASRLASGGIW